MKVLAKYAICGHAGERYMKDASLYIVVGWMNPRCRLLHISSYPPDHPASTFYVNEFRSDDWSIYTDLVMAPFSTSGGEAPPYTVVSTW